MQVPLAAHSYQARSLPLSAQRLLNLYPEVAPPDAKSKLVLLGTPGLKLFSTGTNAVRGVHRMKGILYAVRGTEVYKVASDGASTKLGDVTGTDDVVMADNGTQLVIVGDDKGWVVESDAVTEITDPDFPTPSSVAYIDGYFLFTEKDSGQFFISALYDGMDYDALDFATAESAPDDNVAVFVDHREVWLFGENSIEVWYNSGDAAFPFDRITGATLERGCAGKSTIAKLNNSVFWLGDDGIVYRAEGYTPTRVSTHAIEYAIAKATGTPRAWTYTQEGHEFYVLSYDDGTFVYDASAGLGLWHERGSWTLPRWRVECGCACYGKVMVGDYVNGNIYELDLDTYTENGTVISRVAVSPPVHADGKWFKMPYFELEVESGAGLTSGQGSDPQAMLDWSDDGGKTWSNELWAAMGKIGEYTRRSRWTRLGRTRSRYMRVTISEPVKIAIISAETDPRVGT